MHTKLEAMRAQCNAIIANATAEMEVVRRPVQNEVLLHYRQALDMLKRAQQLDLMPPDAGLPVANLLQLRCQALKAAYQLKGFPECVAVDTIVWPAELTCEEGLAIDVGLSDAQVHATLLGYLSPYVRAIGIRGLNVKAIFSMFGDELHITLSAPVFP